MSPPPHTHAARRSMWPLARAQSTRPPSARSPPFAAAHARHLSAPPGRSRPASRACHVAALQLCSACALARRRARAWNAAPSSTTRRLQHTPDQRDAVSSHFTATRRRRSRRLCRLPHAAAPGASPRSPCEHRKASAVSRSLSRRASSWLLSRRQLPVSSGWCRRSCLAPPPPDGRVRTNKQRRLCLGSWSRSAGRAWPPLTAHLPRERCCFERFVQR